jgi:hypothetical protein
MSDIEEAVSMKLALIDSGESLEELCPDLSRMDVSSYLYTAGFLGSGCTMGTTINLYLSIPTEEARVGCDDALRRHLSEINFADGEVARIALEYLKSGNELSKSAVRRISAFLSLNSYELSLKAFCNLAEC